MGLGLEVRIPGLAQLVGRLESFREDQLPFALSLAMNRAAKDAKDRFRPHFGTVFDLRSKSLHKTMGPFGSFGKSTADGWSHRDQWPSLQVVFGSVAHALELQESGGEKPRRAPKVWIPTRYVERGATGRKKLRHRKATIERRLQDPRGAYVVFERKGTIFERSKATGETRPLYIVRRRATVPPRLGLEGLIVDTYNAKLWPRFSEAMARAMRSAKTSNRYTGRKSR